MIGVYLSDEDFFHKRKRGLLNVSRIDSIIKSDKETRRTVYPRLVTLQRDSDSGPVGKTRSVRREEPFSTNLILNLQVRFNLVGVRNC